MNGARIQKTLGVIAPPKNKSKNEEDTDNVQEKNDDTMEDDEKTVADPSENTSTNNEGKAKGVVKTEKKLANTASEEVVGSAEPLKLDIGDLYSEEVSTSANFP